ncbi:MAG: rhodanese-like domain-containing protein [Synechococcaceae cyanobacterium SM2_3_1]|nr:rhodanese-like domain-containing protein [Synechococcaceae cyanobacterium SM2_3_1]
MRNILGLIVIPDGLKPQSTAKDLQTRLQWGEPALTIVDVRDAASFKKSRIMGAVSVPMNKLIEEVQESCEPVRDIYVYGDSDEATATAAQQLRQAGFISVAELKGGLSAWQSAGYPVEKGVLTSA